jgi:hypothetical protein
VGSPSRARAASSMALGRELVTAVAARGGDVDRATGMPWGSEYHTPHFSNPTTRRSAFSPAPVCHPSATPAPPLKGWWRRRTDMGTRRGGAMAVRGGWRRVGEPGDFKEFEVSRGPRLFPHYSGPDHSRSPLSASRATGTSPRTAWTVTKSLAIGHCLKQLPTTRSAHV